MIGLLGVWAMALWGAFWGLVRSQDGPYWAGKPEEAGGNKWKESGVALFGLPLALLCAWQQPGPWWHSVLAGAMVLGLVAGAWSQGHKKGMLPVTKQEMLGSLGSGAILGVGPAAWLVAQGGWSLALALLPVLFGAGKLPCYLLAMRLRRGKETERPHPEQLGALLHGGSFAALTFAVLWPWG